MRPMRSLCFDAFCPRSSYVLPLTATGCSLDVCRQQQHEAGVGYSWCNLVGGCLVTQQKWDWGGDGGFSPKPQATGHASSGSALELQLCTCFPVEFPLTFVTVSRNPELDTNDASHIA